MFPRGLAERAGGNESLDLCLLLQYRRAAIDRDSLTGAPIRLVGSEVEDHASDVFQLPQPSQWGYRTQSLPLSFVKRAEEHIGRGTIITAHSQDNRRASSGTRLA